MSLLCSGLLLIIAFIIKLPDPNGVLAILILASPMFSASLAGLMVLSTIEKKIKYKQVAVKRNLNGHF